MKKWCIIICTFITLFASGCNRKIEINFNEDYIPFEGYEFEEDDFLMRKGEEEADLLGGIYTLKGLSYKEYVGYVQYSIIPGKPTKTLYGHKNADEPMIHMDPDEILLTFDDCTLTIDDTAIVGQLVDCIRNEGIQTDVYPDVYPDKRINMSFIFDIPCDLTWGCNMVADETDIKMIWYNNKEKEQYVYDVTDIFKQCSLVNDIYSLCD